MRIQCIRVRFFSSVNCKIRKFVCVVDFFVVSIVLSNDDQQMVGYVRTAAIGSF